MSRALASRVIDSAEAGYFRQAMAVADSDVRKLFHDPLELFARLVQPTLWLIVFGQVLNRSRAIPTGGISALECWRRVCSSVQFFTASH
jgi:hypothetical protein